MGPSIIIPESKTDFCEPMYNYSSKLLDFQYLDYSYKNPKQVVEYLSNFIQTFGLKEGISYSTRCLASNNCGIIFEDIKEMREVLWDKYYTNIIFPLLI